MGADVMILWVGIASCKTTPTQGGPIRWALPLIHLVIAHIISERTLCTGAPANGYT